MDKRNNNEAAKRNSTLDIAKGLGMTFVVMFHAKLFPEIFTQFHMPLFAFLSGYVYREKNNSSSVELKKYVKKKISRCYVPFVVYNGIFLILHNLLYYIHILGPLSGGKLFGVKDSLFQMFMILTMGGGESLPGPMWYLIAMLEFTVLYAVLRYIVSRKTESRIKLDVTVTCICMLFLAMGFSNIDFPRMLNRAFVLLFYYNLGYMTYTSFPQLFYNENNAFNRNKLLICITGFVVLLVCVRGGADWPAFSVVIIPAGIAGIAITLVLASFLDKHTQGLRQVLMYIGKHTMFILGTQYLWFKAGNALQVVLQGRGVTWLEMYGVDVQESIGWKIVYFLCGLGIPLVFIKAKETFTGFVNRNRG